jgi:hypothetical protein
LTEVGVRGVLCVVGANIVDRLGVVETIFVVFSRDETSNVTPVAFRFGEG